MIKGIIFDFDETLVNSLETYWQIFNRGATKLNLPPASKEKLVALLSKGRDLKGIVSEIYPSLDTDAILNCTREMQQAYAEVEREFPITLKPRVKEVLRLLKMKGLKIGLVTGRVVPLEKMWAELDRLGITQFFDAVVTGIEARRKPAPDGVIKCLEELKLPSKDCVLIGDAQADVTAGKEAGVRVIVLSTGVCSGEILDTEQPDMVIDDLTQLGGFLEQEA